MIELLTTPTGAAYLTLIAESQHDPALAEDLADRYIARRRTAATNVIERGIARGELRADLDPGTVIDLLYGAVYYRLLVSQDTPNVRYADQLIDHTFPGLTALPIGRKLIPHWGSRHDDPGRPAC